ncbi:MAG: DnaD domain protein, partial [Bacteroidales bacterium]|nr:DnaD domain protein [Bacteroidales bacterium]
SKLEAILNNSLEKTDDYDLSKLNDYLSDKMKRILTSNELEVLQSWMFEDHYKYEEIIDAIDSIVQKKRALSVRTITQVLANKKVEIKPKKEAPQALMEFYNKI